MIGKEEAVQKVRKQYPSCYLTGMSQWDSYYVFYLKAKDPNHKMYYNTPFDVVVNGKGEIGTCNLSSLAQKNGKSDEFQKAIRDNYVEMDKIPKNESTHSFIDDMIKEFGR